MSPLSQVLLALSVALFLVLVVVRADVLGPRHLAGRRRLGRMAGLAALGYLPRRSMRWGTVLKWLGPVGLVVLVLALTC